MNEKLINLSIALSLTSALLAVLVSMLTFAILYILRVHVVFNVMATALVWLAVSVIGALQSAYAIKAASPSRARDENGRFMEKTPVYDNGELTGYLTRDKRAKVRAR